MTALTRRRALQLSALTAGAVAIQHATRSLPGAFAQTVSSTLRPGRQHSTSRRLPAPFPQCG